MIKRALYLLLFAVLLLLTAAAQNDTIVFTLQVCQALEFVDEGIPLVNILQTSMNNAMVIVSYRDLQRHPENADSMFVYSRSILLNNPDFYNCSIAFEPDYFKDRGRC
jgi:hypothetical protein